MIGLTLEVTLNADQFRALGQGQNVVIEGRFEDGGRGIRLVAEKIEPQRSGKGGA